MEYPCNRDFGRSMTNHGGQKHATQSVAQRVAVAALERFQSHFRPVKTELLDVDGFGFQQICLHAEFLSIPPARYTSKANEVPDSQCPATQVRVQMKLMTISANTTRRSAIH